MSKDTQAALKNRVIESVSIHLNPDKIRKNGITLSIEGKIELRIPKEEDDLSILLVANMKIKSQEDENDFLASFVANFFFEIDEKLSGYDEIVTQECMPVIQEETKKITNGFLSQMGFPGVFREE